MGTITKSTPTTLCIQKDALQFRLKPAELVRQLNAVGYGAVISDRQMFRHRQRAGGRFEDGKFIILTSFTAWIIDERHRRQQPRSSRLGSTRSKDPISEAAVINLLQSQSYLCALSGEPLAPDETALDHILPISRGGEHVIINAQAITKTINRAKGTMTNEEFIAMCRRVVTWIDQQNTTHASELKSQEGDHAI